MMKKKYDKPHLSRFGRDFGNSHPNYAATHLSLSHKDILGLVEDSLHEAGGVLPTKIACKRRVLELLSESNLAAALHVAIVGSKTA